MKRVLTSFCLLAFLVVGANAASFTVDYPASITATTVAKHELYGNETCTLKSVPPKASGRVVTDPAELSLKAYPLKGDECDLTGAQTWATLFPKASANFDFASTALKLSDITLKMPPQGGGEGYCFVLKDTTSQHTTTYQVKAHAVRTAAAVIPFVGALSLVLLNMYS
ncbi:hypothetical protein BESB_025030 [Besnoitia besnoiti]|uniref:SAG-related sequence n=1 Tax=Besnoitia besnoiti TaxID=94643 RepID=A0A2A9M7B4_BESBE|nr:uncharacterized protein BESB_025030 [Besnoitia besnoiti]PFH31537.1 hypothetical protein BESB_025030 [Besnoitia besnoiti]